MLYTVNGHEYSSDSTPNQKILDQLINREVFCNMNLEMDFILSALAYDASIPEAPPFDESDYESSPVIPPAISFDQLLTGGELPQ